MKVRTIEGNIPATRFTFAPGLDLIASPGLLDGLAMIKRPARARRRPILSAAPHNTTCARRGNGT